MSKHSESHQTSDEKAEAQRVKHLQAEADAHREKELATRKALEEAQKKHANVVPGNLKVG